MPAAYQEGQRLNRLCLQQMEEWTVLAKGVLLFLQKCLSGWS